MLYTCSHDCANIGDPLEHVKLTGQIVGGREYTRPQYKPCPGFCGMYVKIDESATDCCQGPDRYSGQCACGHAAPDGETECRPCRTTRIVDEHMARERRRLDFA